MKKTQKQTLNSAVSSLAALVAGTLLISPGSVLGQNSPTGVSWDCLINGNQGVGVAYVNFYGDGSLDGMSIMRPIIRPPASIPSDSSDRNSGDVGRYPDGSGGSPTPIVVVGAGVYGYGPVTGTWNYDANGMIIGNFFQVIDNGDGGTNSVAVTNSIGFKALVVPNRRLTLVAYAPENGRSVFRGIPLRDDYVAKLNTLTESSWYGAQVGEGQIVYEFFDLAPMWQPGAYMLSGSGATYQVYGYAIMSTRGRIGFAVTTNNRLRSTVGTFSRRTSKALTSGILEPDSIIRFNAYQYPISPAL